MSPRRAFEISVFPLFWSVAMILIWLFGASPFVLLITGMISGGAAGIFTVIFNFIPKGENS